MAENFKTISVEMYVMIPFATWRMTEKQYETRFNKLIAEIVQLTMDSISIKQISASDSVPEIVDFERRSLLSPNTILKFEITKVYGPADFKDPENKKLGESIYNHIIENSVIHSLYAKICDLMTCANIILPGICGMRKCILFKDGEYQRSIDFFSFQNTVQLLSSSLSDHLCNDSMELSDAINWFKKIIINDGYSSTPLGRAIGALNQLLFFSLDENNATMWTLVAIEALYCREGEISKLIQIVDKANLIDGLQASSKDLKDMYDARSRFLHGDRDFPIYPVQATYQDTKENQQRDEKVRKHLHTAMELLFTTIQYMVLHDKQELNFKRGYTLE